MICRYHYIIGGMYLSKKLARNADKFWLQRLGLLHINMLDRLF